LGALVWGQSGGYAVVDFGYEGFAGVQGVFGGVYGVEELYEDDAGVDGETAFFHDAVRVGAGHGNDRNAGLDGHDRSSLLEWLQAAVRAARTFGINQKRLALTKGFYGFFNAFDGGVSIRAIDGDEAGLREGLADDGDLEKRALEENGDAARDGADDGRGVRGAGVICGKDASAGRDAFGTLDLDMDADAVDEEHDALDGGPVERIEVFGEVGVEDEGRPDEEDIEEEEEADEGGAKHWFRNFGGIGEWGQGGRGENENWRI